MDTRTTTPRPGGWVGLDPNDDAQVMAWCAWYKRRVWPWLFAVLALTLAVLARVSGYGSAAAMALMGVASVAMWTPGPWRVRAGALIVVLASGYASWVLAVPR